MDVDLFVGLVQILLILLLIVFAFIFRELSGRFADQEATYRAAVALQQEKFFEIWQTEMKAEREARLRSEQAQIEERLKMTERVTLTPQELADKAAAASPEWEEAHMTEEERIERERAAAEIDAQLASRGIVAPGPLGA